MKSRRYGQQRYRREPKHPPSRMQASAEIEKPGRADDCGDDEKKLMQSHLKLPES
jgi:hypothetical protein